MENGNKPINPILDWNEVKADSIGLTKHEFFVGLAMQGLLANSNTFELPLNVIAKHSIEMVDELLKQLES
jgi:hypothetical protein